MSAWLPASGLRSATASWTRIDRLAGGRFVRIDRDEFDMAVLVERDLPERRQFADLAAGFIERVGPVKRLELSGEAEIRPAQLELIEAGGHRQCLLDHEPGGVSGGGIEAELDLAVRIFLVPGGFVVLHGQAEIDGIVEFRGRN